mgnify:CR=1 FL=1
MPYIDGIELSEYIYKNHPKISIIIFSGFDEFEYAKKAIKYNVEEYILKPVTASELSKILTDIKKKRDQKKEKEKKLNYLNETYKKNKIYIKSKVLADFITGSKTDNEIIKELREANIELNGPYYKVGIIDINNNSDFFDMTENIKQQRSLMAFAVFNISDEILSNNQAGTVCLVNNHRLFILFQNKELKESKSKQIGTQIREQVKRYLKIDLSITIGNSVKNQKDIYKSYEQAQDLIKYQYLFGENSVIDSKDIEKSNTREVILDDKIDDLIVEIKMNNKQEISSILSNVQEIIKQAFTNKNISILQLQQIVIGINDKLQALDLTDNILYNTRTDLLTAISKSKTLYEGIELLKEYCFQVAKELDKQKESLEKRRALLAMNYIEKNYWDSSINLNAVCSYLNISVSRFSEIFKNETGETFMEALTRVRMEKAKDLLENTNLRNYEIADRVGFNDPHYFSIAFKKITGKSPTEYAKGER